MLVIGAGAYDIRENIAILNTLDDAKRLVMPSVIAIAGPAWSKWWLLFAALACQTPLLFAGRPRATLFTFISRILGVAANFFAASGMIACWLHHDARLESSATGLACVTLYIFDLAVLGDGTKVGLDRLASYPLLSWLSRWPSFFLGESDPAPESFERHLSLLRLPEAAKVDHSGTVDQKK
jgi:hypothetical protein